MSTISSELKQLIHAAGFHPRKGATVADIERVEKSLGVQLPAEFAELWLFSDGLDGDEIDILSLAEVEEYAGAFAGYGFFPFTDCHDSNPYAVWCRDPLRSFVVHIFHDEPAILVCRGLGRFLELIASVGADDDDGVDRIPGDFAFDLPIRTAEDEATGRELVQVIEKMDPEDEWRGGLLQFAAQLFGTGAEEELANIMARGDEYTREAVRQRWRGIDSIAARDLLRKDNEAFDNFLNEFRQALESAGLQTQPARGNEFCLQPGNIGLNFSMLFASCRSGEAMEHWVQVFKQR